MEGDSTRSRGVPVVGSAALVALVVLVAIFVLSNRDDGGDEPRTTEFAFVDDEEGWSPGFADLPVEATTDPSFNLVAEWRELPTPLDGGALFSGGDNQSDDLWMYWTRRIDGLIANTTYQIDVAVELASNVPSGLVGIGGSPGDSVFVKVGASTIEPMTVVDGDGWLRMNIDLGSQSSGGSDAVVIGTISNPNLAPESADGTTFALMTLDGRGSALTGTADADGALWVLVGTDSGFEGRSEIYYSRIAVGLESE